MTLGVVNHALAKLQEAIPEASDWPASLHLHKEQYHGSGFEGNEVSTLLKNVDRLTLILQQCNREGEGQRFVAVFQRFYELNHVYSEPQVNLQNLHTKIDGFMKAWKDSGLNLIPKVHLIQAHLAEFVQLRGSRNMYIYSEQAHESLHAEYAKVWAKYCIKETSNPHYKDKLLRSVSDYNGSHGV